METVYAPSHAHTRPLPKGNRHETDKEASTTPKERLHTVEEFAEKLEQAVLERFSIPSAIIIPTPSNCAHTTNS